MICIGASEQFQNHELLEIHISNLQCAYKEIFFNIDNLNIIKRSYCLFGILRLTFYVLCFVCKTSKASVESLLVHRPTEAFRLSRVCNITWCSFETIHSFLIIVLLNLDLIFLKKNNNKNKQKKQGKFDEFISPDERLFERNMKITKHKSHLSNP